MFFCCCANDSPGIESIDVLDQDRVIDSEYKGDDGRRNEGALAQDEGTFVVEVEKTPTVKSAGVIVGKFNNQKYSQTLLVRDINEGLIQNYNNYAPSGKQINKGDAIVEVNGVRGDTKAMLAKVASDKMLRFVIKSKEMMTPRSSKGTA